MATLQAKITKDQETLAKMQIADKQAKDRKKDESVDEISENLRSLSRQILIRLVWNTNMIIDKEKNTFKDNPAVKIRKH